ncbi:UPF0251 protein [Syntrophobotulus glycolicus DSM 8271]|uniref:UPF0251 protein Sgly_2508 n=1 Tax=Syntrophobotulus glycolicus (strain DSM 8271 / FlGlyR) TaxID=645991 RepID=F0SW08_SYNGF|nr:DUF134 domain-containing protein [Syntrophobotulus glycolicus]ADY56792.1 UPF0251 protein [Syntrophobotulus glycolicus DSM 8271]
MPRPRKGRRVCCLPGSNLFGPLDAGFNQSDFVIMSVDEYESIRLIDLQEFTQEECAEQMHIARTTVQRTYNDARKKLAESLVNGKFLRIEGGDYELCNGIEKTCACGGCRKHRCDNFNNDNTRQITDD